MGFQMILYLKILTVLSLDTPVKPLCSIDPSLNDNPTISITHITVDPDRRGAAMGFDFVDATQFEA